MKNISGLWWLLTVYVDPATSWCHASGYERLYWGTALNTKYFGLCPDICEMNDMSIGYTLWIMLISKC